MNQTYLKGFIEDTEESIVFKATPENIAAFIVEHYWRRRVVVTTLDHRMFLTAHMGIVDACPDRQYLNEKLLPELIRISDQFGQKVGPQPIPPDSLNGMCCPLPDWNFLHFAGYSDRKYQMIRDKSGLLPYHDGRRKHMVEVQVQTYQQGNNLAVSLVPWRGMTPGEEIWLTVNLGEQLRPNLAHLDIKQVSADTLDWLETNHIAQPTGRSQQNGFFVYPEFSFDPARLMQLDPDGYEQHLRMRAEPTKRKDRDANR